MAKFDDIKMQELEKVEDPDGSGGVTLHFAGGRKVRITARDGSLSSEVI
ncbi:MAG: hypothetical protein MPI95_03840 [Nitrosopumilus sp.]|nr:hypothetical protein [Nitrosopumilus sp.]MDA7958207.1 hypothetical protein [Nitrosopumilus sp.]